MTRTLLIIALLLSLVFNAFFLLGRFSTETVATADPAQRLAQSLDLTDRQRVRFNELRTQLHADTAAPRAHFKAILPPHLNLKRQTSSTFAHWSSTFQTNDLPHVPSRRITLADS
jgi:hypothetical protein